MDSFDALCAAIEADGLRTHVSSADNSPINITVNNSRFGDETLYTSAFEDQTWLAETKEQAEDQESATNGATPTLSNTQELTPVINDFLTISRDSAPKHEDNIKAEMSALQKRMEALKKELENKKNCVQSAENSRFSQVRKKAIDSPIDFARGSKHASTETTASELHSYNNFLSEDEEEPGYQSSFKSRVSHESFSNSTFALRKKGSEIAKKLVATATDGVKSSLKQQPAQSVQYFDSFFGIHVTNPKISSSTFQGYVSERQKVKLSQLHMQSNSVNWDDWVTMAVLVAKTPRKKTITGKDYLIWTLCDLCDCKQIVKLFLFGGPCVDQHWKSLPGAVLAVLNASLMPKRDQNDCDNGLALKIDNPQKVIEIGNSPDFAYCKCTRKNDGKRCTNVVNKSKCEVCDFHVLSVSKKYASRRGELASSLGSQPKKFMRTNFGNMHETPSGLITISPQRSSSFCLGSSTSSAKPKSRKSVSSLSLFNRVTANKKAMQVIHNVHSSAKPKTDLITMTKLKTEFPVDVKSSNGPQPESEPNGDEEEKDAFVELLSKPSVGSRNLLKQLSQDSAKQISRLAERSPPETKVNSSTSKRVENAPPAAKISCKQFLAAHCSKNKFGTASLEATKARAVAIMRQARAKAVVKGDQKRKVGMGSSSQIDLEIEDAPECKKQKLGDINLTKEDMNRLLSTKSAHDSELSKDEIDRQESYFKILESKEKVEQRAIEIRELPSKVVTCSQCDYTWHAQSDMCKKLLHKVFWHQAMKRFFKCKQCSTKTISYLKYPTKRCSSCSGVSFERTAMKQERILTRLPDQVLKVRGDEEQFLK